MKKLIIGTLFSVLLLTLVLPGIALADPGEGMDVDIAVVGDNSDVDVSVYGDNSTISVNGDGLATMNDLVRATTGSRGDLITWQAARRADNWVRGIGQYLPDAIAILILESGEHDGQLVVNTVMLQDHELSIISNSQNIDSIWQSILALDTLAQDTNESIASLEQSQLDMERKWLISIIVFGTIGMVVAIIVVELVLRKGEH